MNIGYIYKITNLINGKTYVGQTSRPYKIRFFEHKHDAFDKKSPNYKSYLYNSIRKYGIENFSFEIIEKCDIEILDEKEIYYINLFDTFYNGYNSTLGGQGAKKYEFNELEIVKEYKKIENIHSLAKKYKCSTSTIANILKKHNVVIKPAIEHAYDNSAKVICYNLNGQTINTFNSIHDAARWVISKKMNTSTKVKTISNLICRHIWNKKPYLNYIWDSVFYTNEEKEIKNKTIIENRKKYESNYIQKKDDCPLCNKNKKSINSTYCKECSNKQLSEQFTKEREQKISREELKQLIRTTPFIKIGEQFGVSDNAIRKWCTRYGLPTKSSEIKKYTNEEWKNI